MDKFRDLASFLEDSLANPDSTTLNRLQHKLEGARPTFLALLDILPKNPKERERIGSGTTSGTFVYLPTGAVFPTGVSLAKDVIFLSDALSASEDLCASLISFGINDTTRAGKTEGRAEIGLEVFLAERANLLRCLQMIWKGALSPDENLISSGVQKVLHKETQELTSGKGRMGASSRVGEVSFIQKIILAIEKGKEVVNTLEQSLAGNGQALTSVQQRTTFSDDTVKAHIWYRKEERNLLSQLLFLIGAAEQMTAKETLLLLQQLSSTTSTDTTSIYLLVATLSTLEASGEDLEAHHLAHDTSFISEVNKILKSNWTYPQLRFTVQLQWTVFLDSAARHIDNFETDGGEAVESMTWQAIEGGTLSFLGRVVLGFKRDAEVDDVWSGIGKEMLELGSTVEVDESFQDYVTEQVEHLVLEIITNKILILRKLRNREEDVLTSSHRGGGYRVPRGGVEERSEPRHDLEALFLLIATIYRSTPDAGLKFWDESLAESSSSSVTQQTSSRLAAFLRWGSECKPLGMKRAYYEMVSSLASGPQSATHAFEFLSANGPNDGNSNYQSPPSADFSWSTLFGALDFYHTSLPDRPVEAGANAEGGLGEMPPEEVPLLRSFVRLLRQVVAFSDVARATLYDNQRDRPIATLFALLGRPIPLELKASLLSAISAFSRPGGTFGVDVARRTWVALELSQILPTLAVSEGRDARGGAGLIQGNQGIMRGSVPLSIEGGIFTELEEVEAPNKIYPQSTAFVELLNNLIHTPSSLEPIRRGVEIDTQTIPDNLGSPHRAPGIDPYVRFVVDDVLLKTSIREFSDLTERWKVTEVCLAFVEKCLGSYDLGPFLAAASVGSQQSSGGINSPLAHLILHPGFDILTRILSAGDLLDSILTIIIAGYDAIANNLAGTPLFTQCMLRCMRIVKRTLELQSPFLEVVLPTLGDGLVHIPQDKLNRLKSLAPIDQSLLYHSEAIVQIALLVGCEEEDEISLLAIQILSVLSDSPFFDVLQRFPDQNRGQLNRLVGLLESSPETLRIQTSFVNRLNSELFESELETGDWDGPEAVGGGSIRQAIRSAILDLFLQNTQPDRSGPNLAHLLLGFNVQSLQSEMEIDDPDFSTTQLTSLHIILGLLNPPPSEDEEERQITLLDRYPTFAAKCYRLIRQLCLHQYTSAALSRYLRNREKFFLRQCVLLPLSIPTASKGSLGGIEYPDGKKIITSSTAVCAIFQSEAWLLESTALEMNVLATGNDIQRQLELVKTLFISPTSEGDDSMFFQQGGMQQGLPRMLEIFHSFDFAWHDSIQATDVRISYFAELRFDSCLKIDSTGCEVYDFGALLSLIGAARRELQNRGVINTQAQHDDIKKETRAIVETLVIENHRREIQFARLHSLRAWRSLLDITLAKSFHLLPRESRHSLLLDLMIAILPPIAAQETDQAISELLSGAAVLLMTKLRDERICTVFVDSIESVQLASPEQLHSILKSVLHAILQPGISAIVRGNLYAVLLNYVQYSTKMSSNSPSLTRALGDETNASINDDVLSLDGMSSIGGTRRPRRNALESGNLTIFQSALDRLLPIICRDATVGHEVWRTVAFTVLDALTKIAQEGRATTKVLSILSKQGYLPSFVASLKDCELDLLEALKPEPESLNALYVYEAQMSFLIRLASTREGAEKLLSAELLSKLSQCEYLGSRPQGDSVSMDFDGFVPPATERHHQLLLPALQLVVGTLVSFGSDTPIATQQAVAFVAGQRETLLLALKDCISNQTIASLREAHLIITLLSIILPSVPEEDLTTLSSFGGLHSTLSNLSAKICGSQEWVNKIIPTNDGEREDDQILVMALRNPGTVFTEKVENLVEALEVAILTYLTVSTRKRAGTNAFRPIYTPSFRQGESGSSSLGSASTFIRSIISTLSNRLSDVVTISRLIEHFDTTSLDEIEETLTIPSNDNNNSTEHRNQIYQEVLLLQTSYRLQVASSLHLLEISLLLYWRNIQFFLDTERIERESISSSSLSSSRPEFGRGNPINRNQSSNNNNNNNNNNHLDIDINLLKQNLFDTFGPLSERLLNLELTQATVGSQFRTRQTYLGIIVRKISELIM